LFIHCSRFFLKITILEITTKIKLQATITQKELNLGILTKLSAANAANNPTTEKYILVKWVWMSDAVGFRFHMGIIPNSSEVMDTSEKK
jgi:hypothetical protein